MRNVRLLLAAALLGVSGCAGHAAQTAAARTALDAGQPSQALAALNEKLGVKRGEDVPASVKDDKILFVLDRSMVLMQLGRYDLASRDLELGDKQLMVLDFSRGATDDVAKYLFSDDSGPYRAPAYEKLLVNTMNMMNYLARGNLDGARVEARRMSVLSNYFKNSGEAEKAFVAPGSYLAGFVFEKSGQADEALRYYDEALAHSKFTTLDSAISRLATQAAYRSPRLEAILSRTNRTDANTSKAGAAGEKAGAAGEKAGAAGEKASAAGEKASAADETGEILVIVNYGRVPAKVAERVPIGLALTYASGAISPYDAGRANRLAAQGLVTWVNYPSLGKPRGQWSNPSFALDSRWETLDGALAVDVAAKKTWDDMRGQVVASAITRLIARLVAGEAVRHSTKDSVLGLLLSLGTQATLTAVDTPDTRSWSTLPARIAIGRVRVKAGTHVVELGASGDRSRHKITVKPGGWVALVHTVLR